MNDSTIIPAADQAILDTTLQYENAVRAKIAALEAKVEGDKVNYDNVIVHGNLMYSFHTHRRFVKANIKDPRERKALIDKVAHCALDPTEKPNFFKVATRESVEADKKKKADELKRWDAGGYGRWNNGKEKEQGKEKEKEHGKHGGRGKGAKNGSGNDKGNSGGGNSRRGNGNGKGQWKGSRVWGKD